MYKVQSNTTHSTLATGSENMAITCVLGSLSMTRISTTTWWHKPQVPSREGRLIFIPFLQRCIDSQNFSGVTMETSKKKRGTQQSTSVMHCSRVHHQHNDRFNTTKNMVPKAGSQVTHTCCFRGARLAHSWCRRLRISVWVSFCLRQKSASVEYCSHN